MGLERQTTALTETYKFTGAVLMELGTWELRREHATRSPP